MVTETNAKRLAKLWSILPLGLMAIAFVAPSRAWGQCVEVTNISTSATPSFVVDGTLTNILLTFKLST